MTSPVIELAPGRLVGGTHPCFVIAEVGQNHQGDLNIAMEMIRKAALAKCDCVKFQKSYSSSKFTASALSRPYESVHSFGATYGEHKAHLEFTDEQFYALQRYANNEGILFTASAMDRKSADFLLQLNVPFIKIGSGDTNNYPLIDHIAKMKKPIVYSTGMHDLSVIRHAYELITASNNASAVLHCISSYPTPPQHINLNVVQLYREQFPLSVIGYSGHEKGIAISIASVALGAKILERHMTLDKQMKGNDHSCSLEPDEFRLLVEQVREVELSLGTKEKKRQSSELPCYLKLGKSVVSTKAIPEGSVITEKDLDIKVSEPNGIEAHFFYDVVHRVARHNIAGDTPIQYSDLN